MPRRRSALPKLCHHKPSNRAVVYIDRKAVYLGPHGSADARERYGKLIADLAQGKTVEAIQAAPTSTGFTVSDLLLRYFREKLPRYAEAEQSCQKAAIKILRTLFGETAAVEFGPLRLRVVRDQMIAGDPEATGPDGTTKPRKPWSRGFVNKQVKRLQAIFRWGISWELVPQSVADALTTVEPLRKGESDAVDYAARRAVPADDIKAVRAVLCDRHRDIFDLLLLTGARPGEVIGLRISDVDRRGDVWRADLKSHKTAHLDKSRTLFFNRVAQAILLRHLKADPTAPFFPIQRHTFCVAVKTACVKAGVSVFTPHWLRHTVATLLADDMGVEAAQRLLGHSGKATTQHYAKAAERLAMKAAERLGIVG